MRESPRPIPKEEIDDPIKTEVPNKTPEQIDKILNKILEEAGDEPTEPADELSDEEVNESLEKIKKALRKEEAEKIMETARRTTPKPTRGGIIEEITQKREQILKEELPPGYDTGLEVKIIALLGNEFHDRGIQSKEGREILKELGFANEDEFGQMMLNRKKLKEFIKKYTKLSEKGVENIMHRSDPANLVLTIIKEILDQREIKEKIKRAA